MAKMTFDSLPVDIKALVVERVLRPTDLVNVCLVNKQFHELAVKPLYNSIALDLGMPNDTRLSAFLNPQNIGLKHIRRVKISFVKVRDTARCSGMQQAQLMCRMLLEFLPEDILEDFSWCPWEPFWADSLLLLYRKQRKLKWLEVMKWDRDIVPTLKKDEKLMKNMFGHARQLAMYPEDRSTLSQCEFYLTNMKDTLENLHISTGFDDMRDSSPDREMVASRELNDSATAPGLLTSTIFSSLMPFEKCSPLPCLTQLELSEVNLRHCADTWCKFIPFQQIQELRLSECGGADALLAQLSKAAHLPKQLRVLHFQHDDNRESEALLTLDGFLCLVSGVQELLIDLFRVSSMPASAGIVRHSKTLQVLNVHCSPQERIIDRDISSTRGDTYDEICWSPSDFEAISKGCSRIEQLSCASPSTELLKAATPGFISFMRSCNYLRRMVTLHITNWPSGKSTNYLPRVVYEQLLRALAQRMFKEVATHAWSYDVDTGEKLSRTDVRSIPGQLRLIAFGVNEKMFEREDSKHQIIYYRSTCIEVEGPRGQLESCYAATVGWCLRRYIEPRSEILDCHLLSRASRPPCRETSSDRGLSWGGDDDDD